MTKASRRTFLAAAGTGAAIASTVALTSSADAAPSGAPDSASSDPAAPGDGATLVAYVHGHATSDVTVLTGERERVVHDPALARQLRRAAGR